MYVRVEVNSRARAIHESFGLCSTKKNDIPQYIMKEIRMVYLRVLVQEVVYERINLIFKRKIEIYLLKAVFIN